MILATHSSFGPATAKSHFTRSGAGLPREPGGDFCQDFPFKALQTLAGENERETPDPDIAASLILADSFHPRPGERYGGGPL